MPDHGSEQTCRWPTCPLEPVGQDDHEDWWCTQHLAYQGEDLEYGIVAPCAVCNKLTCTWLGMTPLHTWCSRAWAMGAVSLKPVGAYARRRG